MKDNIKIADYVKFQSICDRRHLSEKDAGNYLALIADVLEHYACQEELISKLTVKSLYLREMAEPFKNYSKDLSDEYTCDEALTNFTNSLGLTSGHARPKSISHEIYGKVNNLLHYEYKSTEPFEVLDTGINVISFLCDLGPEDLSGRLPDVYSCRKPLSKKEAIKAVAKQEGISISNVKKSFYTYYQMMEESNFINTKESRARALKDQNVPDSIILEFENNTDFFKHQKSKSHLSDEYDKALAKMNDENG